MRYANVNIAAIGYELAPNVVTAEDIEARLAPLYETLHLTPGQLGPGLQTLPRRHPGRP